MHLPRVVIGGLGACALACAAGEATEGSGAATLPHFTSGADGTDGTSFVDPSATGPVGSSDHGLPTTDGSESGVECPIGSLGCPCTPGGACDDPLGCLAGTCTEVPPECGNGEIEGSEACDDGAANGDEQACKSDCTLQQCGDGFVGPGEGCDDGNDDDTDACTNACALASCGDGMVQQGEACDDGNDDDTDACLATCVAASCGDSIVQAGVEGCDDGNPDDSDGCTNACTVASCGDAIVHAGVEECDDGNGNDGDGCTNACACPRLDFADAGDIAGWSTSGGWALYASAPVSSNLEVVFVTGGSAVGTDGNRVPPYPGAEIETSSLTTATFVLPQTLRFHSWHVDEGGASYDTKRLSISTDGGASWTLFVDCADAALGDQPFCSYVSGPRDEFAFDDIAIDLGAFAGSSGQVRLEYDSIDECCQFEQGWFLDDANFVTCG
ncbi:MAG: DUF4215 domain-containing protein [Nannocystaceae bacterium]|nr:DUF4215 domain-containing protein [Nannocystaceae bacterium]